MVDPMHEQNHEDLESLQNYVAAVLNDKPDEEWNQAARHRLQDSLESKQKENWMMSIIKNGQIGKLKWAVAAPIAALLVLALIFGIPEIGGNGSKAFARVARQMRNARTLVYTLVTQVPEMPAGMPEMKKMEIAFKEPGLMRMSTGSMEVSITDFTRKRMITLNTKTKEFIETDFKNLPGNAASEVSDSIDWLRNIPEQADEVLGTQEMGGRLVQGYRVIKGSYHMTAWIDTRSGDLVTIEMDISKLTPGAQAIMSDFRFDVPLDDALFNMTMPEGFHRSRGDMNVDISKTEEDLINFFRSWVERVGEGVFPPSMNAFEWAKPVKAWVEKHDKTHPDKKKNPEEARKMAMIFQKAGMVPLLMKPENDWNYAGQGVKFGDASQPVCWWKPDGSKTYRVIAGDLSVIDLDLDQVPAGGKPLLPDRH